MSAIPSPQTLVQLFQDELNTNDTIRDKATASLVKLIYDMPDTAIETILPLLYSRPDSSVISLACSQLSQAFNPDKPLDSILWKPQLQPQTLAHMPEQIKALFLKREFTHQERKGLTRLVLKMLGVVLHFAGDVVVEGIELVSASSACRSEMLVFASHIQSFSYRTFTVAQFSSGTDNMAFK